MKQLKYSVKPSDLALERDKGAWLHEMTKQVHKMRFIATGGVLKGILKPEDEITTEEMISSSEEVQGRWRGSVAFQFKPEYRRYVYARNIMNMPIEVFHEVRTYPLFRFSQKWTCFLHFERKDT